MKIFIGIGFILLVLPVRGENEVCKTDKEGFKICRKPTTVITHVTREMGSAVDAKTHFDMKFDDDTIIGPNAFHTLPLTSILLGMPYTQERNRLALRTLTLHPDSFLTSSNIRSLTIIRANVNLPGNKFNLNTAVEWLRFIACGFTEVPSEMIESLPNLDYLSFEGNYLRVIRSHAFSPLKLLRELNLEGNGIVSLELGCFDGLDNLEVLDLADNQFPPISGIFNGLKKLTRLDIDNAFGEHQFNFDILQDTPALVNIRMGNNKIKELKPDMFSICPQLTYLSLFRNNISSVPKGVFNTMNSLKMVHLAQNEIGTIEPGAFSGLNMNMIYLLNNKVDKVIETGTFSDLSVLDICLRASNIRELKPRAFNGLSARELDLSENKFTQIGAEDFYGLKVEELRLKNNNITAIAPNAFKNTKVKKLRLFGNLIDDNDRGTWGLPETTEILWSEYSR